MGDQNPGHGEIRGIHPWTEEWEERAVGSCSWLGSGSSRIDRLESASCPKVATVQACVPGPSRIGYSQGVLSGGG